MLAIYLCFQLQAYHLLLCFVRLQNPLPRFPCQLDSCWFLAVGDTSGKIEMEEDGGGRILLFSAPVSLSPVASYSSSLYFLSEFLTSTFPWLLTKVQVSVTLLCVLFPPPPCSPLTNPSLEHPGSDNPTSSLLFLQSQGCSCF